MREREKENYYPIQFSSENFLVHGLVGCWPTLVCVCVCVLYCCASFTGYNKAQQTDASERNTWRPKFTGLRLHTWKHANTQAAMAASSSSQPHSQPNDMQVECIFLNSHTHTIYHCCQTNLIPHPPTKQQQPNLPELNVRNAFDCYALLFSPLRHHPSLPLCCSR